MPESADSSIKVEEIVAISRKLLVSHHWNSESKEFNNLKKTLFEHLDDLYKMDSKAYVTTLSDPNLIPAHDTTLNHTLLFLEYLNGEPKRLAMYLGNCTHQQVIHFIEAQMEQILGKYKELPLYSSEYYDLNDLKKKFVAQFDPIVKTNDVIIELVTSLHKGKQNVSPDPASGNFLLSKIIEKLFKIHTYFYNSKTLKTYPNTHHALSVIGTIIMNNIELHSKPATAELDALYALMNDSHLSKRAQHLALGILSNNPNILIGNKGATYLIENNYSSFVEPMLGLFKLHHPAECRKLLQKFIYENNQSKIKMLFEIMDSDKNSEEFLNELHQGFALPLYKNQSISGLLHFLALRKVSLADHLNAIPEAMQTTFISQLKNRYASPETMETLFRELSVFLATAPKIITDLIDLVDLKQRLQTQDNWLPRAAIDLATKHNNVNFFLFIIKLICSGARLQRSLQERFIYKIAELKKSADIDPLLKYLEDQSANMNLIQRLRADAPNFLYTIDKKRYNERFGFSLAKNVESAAALIGLDIEEQKKPLLPLSTSYNPTAKLRKDQW